jgi:Ca2+-binding EF-hand superfamily protein
MNRLCLVSCIVFVISACGGEPKPRAAPAEEWHPPSELLERYGDKNGVVTRAAIEAGLRADFAAADKDHDGCLDEEEARAVNEARWKIAASATSPLIDFLHNGCIDFDEFAAEPRSVFEQLDRNGDGRLTPQELHPGRRPNNQSSP